MLDLRIPESKSFKDRRNRSFKIVAMYSGVLFLLILLLTEFYYALGVAMFFFVLHIFIKTNEERIFITSLKVLNDDVTVVYKDEENEKLFTAKLDRVTFRKKLLLKRSRAVCLKIYHDGRPFIKQYETGEWDEKKMDEILQKITGIKAS